MTTSVAVLVVVLVVVAVLLVVLVGRCWVLVTRCRV